MQGFEHRSTAGRSAGGDCVLGRLCQCKPPGDLSARTVQQDPCYACVIAAGGAWHGAMPKRTCEPAIGSKGFQLCVGAACCSSVCLLLVATTTAQR